MLKKKKCAAPLALAVTMSVCLIPFAAQAGSISGIRVDPPSIVAGQQAQVTVEGQDEGNCGLRVEYGNGDVDVTRMSAGKDNFPRSFMHTFAGPGTFTVTAKGGRDGSTLGCSGEAKATITVAAPPPPPPAAAVPPPMTTPACPDGWALNHRSVNKYTGAYSCSARRGAVLPQAGIACPAGTAYYTNTQGTLLGCKALPR
jgi:hypothetical protein